MQIQKIDTVMFYPSILELDSFNCYKILKGNNIPHTINSSITKDYSDQILKHLQDFKFNGQNTTVNFDRLPVVIWRIFNDVNEVHMNYAVGSEQLANSTLMINKSLIDANT